MTRAEALQAAKPILFNTGMVRAIQNGTKTVTRRPVKMKYGNTHIELCHNKYGNSVIEKQNDVEGETFGKQPDGTSFQRILAYRDVNPPFKVGDILYVREAWCKRRFIPPDDKAIPVGFKYCEYYYRANGEISNSDGSKFKWKPSIHMPKEAARIFLRVTNVRVERLQDCGNMQAKDEGCVCCSQFVRVWNSTIKKSDIDKYGWNANPWVWVIEFERLEVAEKETRP